MITRVKAEIIIIKFIKKISDGNHPKCNSHELVRLLLYLQSIPRLGEEVGGQNLSQEMAGLGK